MPIFTYTARNRDGQTVTDTVDIESRDALGQMLRTQGLLPTKIEEKRKRLEFKSLLLLFRRVSLLERLTFIKNLSVTLKAGLPVSRALKIVVQQFPNAYFRKVVEDLSHNVEAGKSLSESMAAYPKVFSPIVVNMVKVGESSGDLENTLDYLAKQISRDYDLLRRTKGAMTYPAVVLLALLVIGYLMFAFVLPKLTATFEEFQTELPLLTRLIITVVNIVSHYSIVILVLGIGLLTGLWMLRTTHRMMMIVDRLNLNLPVIKNVVKKLNLARFTIIFAGLLRSGMSIVEALAITSDTMTNIYYRQALADASEKVKIGVDLVGVLNNYPKLFTPMVTQMIQVGEETGTMEKSLEQVATFYEAEIDDTVKNLSSIIEPLLVIIIGAIVGVLAVGLIMPIYNIGQNI